MIDHQIAAILPALNEQDSVRNVVLAFQKQGARVIVVDNGSTDDTARLAAAAGAEVVAEPRPGYGSACLAGIRYLAASPPAIVVFSDCDGTIEATDLGALAQPILSGRADLVLGVRVRIAPGALSWKHRAGNRVSCWALRVLYGLKVRDIPPLRAIRWTALARLQLSHPTYGLPIETLAQASRHGLRIAEVDVAYGLRSGGESKIARNALQAIYVGSVMLSYAVRLRLRRAAAK